MKFLKLEGKKENKKIIKIDKKSKKIMNELNERLLISFYRFSNP